MPTNNLASPARFDEALLFAVSHHGGQRRKCTAIPYVTHPVAVAEVLAYYYPQDHDLTVAGLLHDVVEDTHATLEVVKERFGERVAHLVQALSKPTDMRHLPDDRVAKWKAQRTAMLASLHGEEAGAFRLKAADALVNLQAILRDLRKPDVGERVWSRFKVGRDESLWYYEQILEAVEPISKEVLYRDLADHVQLIAQLGATDQSH